jgi:hypothetical protein
MMKKRKVTFIICTIAVTLLGIASVQIGVNQIAAQQAIVLGAADNTCPSCIVNFSADATPANATSQASLDTAVSNATAPIARHNSTSNNSTSRKSSSHKSSCHAQRHRALLLAAELPPL